MNRNKKTNTKKMIAKASAASLALALTATSVPATALPAFAATKTVSEFGAVSAKEATPKITLRNNATVYVSNKKFSIIKSNTKKLKFTIKSSNPKIAKVNSKGEVMAVKAGKATISVTYSVTVKGKKTKKTVKSVLTVKDPILLNKSAYNVVENEQALVKLITKKYDTKLQVVSATTSNKNVIKINNKTGNFKALKAGTARITLTLKVGNGYSKGGTVKYTRTIKVAATQIEGVTLKNAPEKSTYQKDEALDLNGLVAVVKYSNGTTKTISGADVKVEKGIEQGKYGLQTIEVSYAGFKFSFDVELEAPGVDPTPSTEPSVTPSVEPSAAPSDAAPSVTPSVEPSVAPSVEPSVAPSVEPSTAPSADQPSVAPSTEPSAAPSDAAPSADQPSVAPSTEPSAAPSDAAPSADQPSVAPSTEPSAAPSTDPTPSTPEQAKVTDIDITLPQGEFPYSITEEQAKAALVVKAKYSDGRETDKLDAQYFDVKLDKAGHKATVTVKYEGVEKTVDFTISKAAIINLTADTSEVTIPHKAQTADQLDQVFDGVTFTLEDEAGEKTTATWDQLEVEGPIDTDSMDTNTVTVKVKNNTLVDGVTILVKKEAVKEGIKVNDVAAVDEGTDPAELIATIKKETQFTLSNNEVEDLSEAEQEALNVTLPEGAVKDDKLVAGTYTVDVKLGDKSTTVEVTVKSVLKIASVSVASETSVEVKLDKKPEKTLETSAFTVKENGNPVTVSKVETNEADLTGKTLLLTIDSLNGKQGELTVNDVKATVAKKQVYSFDYKRPTIEGITVVSKNTLKVKFSEKMSQAGLNKALKITKLSTGTPITPQTVVLDADGTSATIVLSTDDSLTVANYVLVVKSATETVGEVTTTYSAKDVKGNTVIEGTEVGFAPTSEELDNTNAASIVKASYNKVTKLLKLTFDRNISDSLVKPEKLSINGVSLAEAKQKADILDNEFVLDLAGQAEALEALTGDLTLTSEAGAYGVAGENGSPDILTKGETVTVQIVKSAVITEASYDEESKKLTVKFDQEVALNKVSAGANPLIIIGDSNSNTTSAKFTVADFDEKLTTGDTWVFDAPWDRTGASKAANTLKGFGDKTKLKAYINGDIINAITNADDDTIANDGTQSGYEDGIALAYTKDANKPVLKSVVFNNKMKRLRVTFSEAIGTPAWSKIKLYTADGTAFAKADLSAVATPTTDDYKTYDIQLDALEGTPTVSDQFEAEFHKQNGIKVVLDEAALEDDADQKNDATTYDTGLDIQFEDYIAPKLSLTPTGESKTIAPYKTGVKVTFSEPVSAETAENVANYTITDLQGKVLNVKKAVLKPIDTANNGIQEVYLTTDEQTADMSYSVVIKNIEDVAGNKAGQLETEFDGASDTEGSFEVDKTDVTVKGEAGADNDYIEVKFTGVPNTHLALDPKNYIIQEADDEKISENVKTLNTTGAEVSLTPDGTGYKAKITFKNGVNLKYDKYYKVTVANVTSITEKALESGKNVTDAKVSSVASITENPTISVCNKKEGAITITFAGDLDAKEAEKTSKYEVKYFDASGAALTLTPSGTITKATCKESKVNGVVRTTVTLDLDKNIPSDAAKITVGLKGTEKLKTLAEEEFTFDSQDIAKEDIEDKVSPTVQSVVAVANGGNSQIEIEFNESVYTKDNKALADDAMNLAHYVLKEDGKAVTLADTNPGEQDTTTPWAKVEVGDIEADTNHQTAIDDGKVTITLNNFNLNTGKKYTMDIAGVQDTSANKMDDVSGVNVAWSQDTDKKAPEIGSVSGDGKTVIINFNEESGVLDAEAGQSVNYTVKEKDSTKTVAVADAEVSGTSVTLTLASGLEAGTAYVVSVKNVSDIYGNAISSTTPISAEFTATGGGEEPEVPDEKTDISTVWGTATVTAPTVTSAATDKGDLTTANTSVTPGTGSVKVSETTVSGTWTVKSVDTSAGTAIVTFTVADEDSNYTGKADKENVEVTLRQNEKPETPDVSSVTATYSGTTLTIDGLTDGTSYEYSLDGTEWADLSAVSSNKGTATVQTGITAGSTTVQVRIKADGATPASDASSEVTITNPKPATPDVTSVKATYSGTTLTIDGLTDGTSYEYSLDGTEWADLSAVSSNKGTATVQTGITAGSTTVQVRIKEDGATPASDASSEVTIQAGQ